MKADTRTASPVRRNTCLARNPGTQPPSPAHPRADLQIPESPASRVSACSASVRVDQSPEDLLARTGSSTSARSKDRSPRDAPHFQRGHPASEWHGPPGLRCSVLPTRDSTWCNKPAKPGQTQWPGGGYPPQALHSPPPPSQECTEPAFQAGLQREYSPSVARRLRPPALRPRSPGPWPWQWRRRRPVPPQSTHRKRKPWPKAELRM